MRPSKPKTPPKSRGLKGVEFDMRKQQLNVDMDRAVRGFLPAEKKSQRLEFLGMDAKGKKFKRGGLVKGKKRIV